MEVLNDLAVNVSNTKPRIAGQSPAFRKLLSNLSPARGMAVLSTLIDLTRIPGDLEKAKEEGRSQNRALVESLSGIGTGGVLSAVNSAFVSEPGDPIFTPTIVGMKSYEGGEEMGRNVSRNIMNFILGPEKTNEALANTTVPVDTREVVLSETQSETPAPVSDPVLSPIPVRIPVEAQFETPMETPPPVVIQETPKPQNALAQKFLEDQMIGNEMANTGELQDLLMRSGAVGSMSEKDLDTWTKSNSALAYRLAEKEGLLSGI